MKAKLYLLLFAAIVFFSCSNELQETTTTNTLEATIKSQKTNWIEAKLTQNIIDNQRTISHYEFNIRELQILVNQPKVTYVWFDLGLNTNNQITFTATGEDKTTGEIIHQVASQIISTNNYIADFSIFLKAGDIQLVEDSKITHILQNSEAFNYLTKMQDAYNNFESVLDQEGQREERFGLDVDVVKRILNTADMNSLGLFLGINNKQKMTTVFIGKDKKGQLLIGENSKKERVSAHDFTEPCPDACD
jgi:hypothetical protein